MLLTAECTMVLSYSLPILQEDYTPLLCVR